MNDYQMFRNPERMSPTQFAGLMHTLADNATDGARLTGTLTWRPVGQDETAGFLVEGTAAIDDDTIHLGEWRMPRTPYRWFGLDSKHTSPAPGQTGPDTGVVRTTSGTPRTRYYRLPSGNWCHQPGHHLDRETGAECAGISWTVLINMYGCLEEDI